ncbi:MAG: NAD(P)H-binding protein [Ignavibacteriales bacterium]|nr:NAD(P)H-binding protein [Ignavibacteriales bacterium]
MKVVILGSGGLTGGHIVQLLATVRNIDEIIAPVRKLNKVRIPKVCEQIFDFSDEGAYAGLFPADAIFCALGTTIKKAGSQEKFREVDFEYPLRAARAASDAGVRHFLLVSALGADAASNVFYNRVKGEVEREILRLRFKAITIVRPSLLLGDRNEFRLGERLLQPFAPLIPAKYKPVQALSVAHFLVNAFFNQEPGIHIVDNATLHGQ